jgi:hypothetical protein
MKVALSKSEELEERDLRLVLKALERRGVSVRREKLARGPAFRVKSGQCEVYGESVFFLDRALAPSQQLALALDYIVENGIQLSGDELSDLRSKTLLNANLQLRPEEIQLEAAQSAEVGAVQ